MKLRISNMTVLITGSSRGIGRQTAKKLLLMGAKVIINGRDAVKLDESFHYLAEFSSGPDQIGAFAGDMSKESDAQKLLAYVKNRFGKLDAVINNPGLSMRGPFQELSTKTYDSIMDANIRTTVNVTKAALPLVLDSKGSILFVSSLAGVRGFPGVSLYSAAKMALTGLAQSIQAEHQHQGLHVGVVYLGFTENDPEKTVLTSQGDSIHHQRKAQLTQDQAAEAIVRSLIKRKRRQYTTFSGKILSFVQGWLPGLTDWLIGRSGGKIHRVSEKT